MLRRKDTALILLAFTFLFWFFASYIDTTAKNLESRDYASWNAFVMMDKMAQAKGSLTAPKEKMKKEGVKIPGKLYTKSNILLLARLIEAENGSAKNDETLVLTGVCVLKRVKAKSYPDTIKGVIYQKGKGGRAYSTAPMLDSITPSERALEIAEELLIYGAEEYPDNLVFQSMFPQGKKVYKRIDGEYFCLA